MYILLVNHFNHTAEPNITQLLSLLVWSELLSPRHTRVILGCYFSLFVLSKLVNANNYLISGASYQKSNSDTLYLVQNQA